MSILQIELPDEIVRHFEEKAAARNVDLQSWLREHLETVYAAENERGWEEEKLLEALDSPVIEATPEWWEKTIADLNAEADARRDTQNGEKRHAA